MLETYIIMIQIIRGANKKETPQIENRGKKRSYAVKKAAIYSRSGRIYLQQITLNEKYYTSLSYISMLTDIHLYHSV